MSRTPRWVALGWLTVALLDVTPLRAAEGGYSNYIPGTYGDFGMALAPTETWTLRQDFYYYDAGADRSVRSGRVEFGVDLNIGASYTTILYKPDIEVLGAKLATGVFLPYQEFDLDAELSLGRRSGNANAGAIGLGDFAWIPFALYWSEGRVHTSLMQLVVMPTGRYDVDRPLNESLNYWSFDTNFALTFLDDVTGRELSFDVGYIYNTENDATDYQTGQELHVDIALNQYLSERFAIGLHGFYLNQLTGDSGDGALLGGFQAEAAGIGPAVLWNASIAGYDLSVIAKWLHEFHAENRLEGEHLFVSFALSW